MVGRERLDLSAKPITDRPQQRWGGDLVSEVTAQEAHHLPTHLQLGEIRDCVAALLVEGQALVDVHLARSGSCTHDWPAPCAPLRILPPTEDSPLTRRIAIAWPAQDRPHPAWAPMEAAQQEPHDHRRGRGAAYWPRSAGRSPRPSESQLNHHPITLAGSVAARYARGTRHPAMSTQPPPATPDARPASRTALRTATHSVAHAPCSRSTAGQR